MTTLYHTLLTRFDQVEAMPDYEGIRHRFLQGFDSFVNGKKYQAVRAMLPEEIQSETLVKNPDFVEAIVRRVEDDAVLEKRYIFLSVNPVALASLVEQ